MTSHGWFLRHFVKLPVQGLITKKRVVLFVGLKTLDSFTKSRLVGIILFIINLSETAYSVQ